MVAKGNNPHSKIIPKKPAKGSNTTSWTTIGLARFQAACPATAIAQHLVETSFTTSQVQVQVQKN